METQEAVGVFCKVSCERPRARGAGGVGGVEALISGERR